MASDSWQELRAVGRFKFDSNACGNCSSDIQNRGQHAPKFDLVEIFAGVGHLSREMIRAGYKGCAFDINFDPTTQDALQACGLKLFVEAVGLVKGNGLAWLGTQCSSFVILCRRQAQRALDNFFLGPGSGGEDSPIFVQVGNGLMEVSSLLFFLCYLLDVWVVLEQPMTSCMPECPSMKVISACRHYFLSN